MDLSSTLFLVFTTHPPTTTNFFLAFKGLDMSDEPRMGWYDSSMVIGGSDFKEDIKRDYRGDIREYFEESIFLTFKGSRQVRWT